MLSQQEISSKLGNERRIALVIGNSRYRYARELANPINDAEAVAEVLARLGFDVVKELDLELPKMGDLQEVFEAKLRSKPDIALLFYAGHGLQVKGLNYLVPIDAQIEVPAHLNFRAIRFNDIFDPMTEGAGASLIFLDACRDNPFTRNLERSLGEGARGSIRGGLARVEKVAGAFIAYATAPDRVAFDGKGLHSPFTAALLKHIETPGLSVSDMMIDVRNSVLAETQGRQEPWDQSSLRAKFTFVPKIEEPKIEEAAKELELSPSATEWDAIQNTTSLAVLTRFRKRYPNPPWNEYAGIRIKELREADDKRRKAAEAEYRRRMKNFGETQGWTKWFPVLVISCQYSLAVLFSNWNGIGAGDFGSMTTGLLVGSVIALISAAALAYWRRATLSGAEIGSYWLGCALVTIIALSLFFDAKKWNWMGELEPNGGAETGYLVGLVIVLSSAAALAYWRRATLSGAEIGRYWLGCALSIALGLLFFASVEQNWLGVGSTLLGLVIALSSAAALAYWRRATLSDAEIRRYWLGCALVTISALERLFNFMEWNWLGVGTTTTGLLVGLVIALVSAATLFYWRKKKTILQPTQTT